MSISEIVEGVNKQLAASRSIVEIVRELAALRDSAQDDVTRKALSKLISRLTEVGQSVANSSSTMAQTIQSLTSR